MKRSGAFGNLFILALVCLLSLASLTAAADGTVAFSVQNAGPKKLRDSERQKALWDAQRAAVRSFSDEDLRLVCYSYDPATRLGDTTLAGLLGGRDCMEVMEDFIVRKSRAQRTPNSSRGSEN